MLFRQLLKVRATPRLFNNPVAFYATATASAQSLNKVKIKPEIAELLKPEVLKIVEEKPDDKLRKKINFVGPTLAVRLNVAKKSILDELSYRNVFRILTRELKDPWIYYWEDVRKNGQDSDKWLESLKEVNDLPIVCELCFKTMLENGVYPMTAHHNQVLKSIAPFLLFAEYHQRIDVMNRLITRDKLTSETYQYLLDMYLQLGMHPFAEIIKSIMDSKGYELTEEQKQRYAQSEEVWNKYKDELAPEVEEDEEDKEDLKHLEQVLYKDISEEDHPYIAAAKKNKKDAEINFSTFKLKEQLQPPLSKLVVQE